MQSTVANIIQRLNPSSQAPQAKKPEEKTELDNLISNNVEEINSLIIVRKKNLNGIDIAAQQLRNAIDEKDAITKPSIDLLNAVEFVMSVVEKSQNLQQKVKNSELTENNQQKKVLNKARLEKLRESIKVQVERANKESEQKTASAVAIGMGVAAFLIGLLAIVTAGSAAVLGIAIASAVLSGSMLGMDIATRVYADSGTTELDVFGDERKKEISFGRLIRWAEEEKFKKEKPDAKNLSEDKKREIEKKFSDIEVGVNIGVTILTIGLSIAGIAASVMPLVKGAFSTLTNIAKTIKDINSGKIIPELLKMFSKPVAVTDGGARVSSTTAKLVTQSKVLKSLGYTGELGQVATIGGIGDDVANIANAISDLACAVIGIQLAEINIKWKTLDNEYKLLNSDEELIDHYRELINQTVKDMSKRYDDDIETLLDIFSSIFQYQSNVANRI